LSASRGAIIVRAYYITAAVVLQVGDCAHYGLLWLSAPCLHCAFPRGRKAKTVAKTLANQGLPGFKIAQRYGLFPLAKWKASLNKYVSVI